MSSNTDKTIAVSVSRSRRPRRQYECQHCPKIFKRSEHCIRHERIHTHEKPFSCQYCFKAYSRKDLVTRHERTLHADRTCKEPGRDQQVCHLGARDALSDETTSEESPEPSEDDLEQTMAAGAPLTPQDSNKTPPAHHGTACYSGFLGSAPVPTADMGGPTPNQQPSAPLIDTVRLQTPPELLATNLQVDIDMLEEGDGDTGAVAVRTGKELQPREKGPGLGEAEQYLGIVTELDPSSMDTINMLQNIQVSPSDMTDLLFSSLDIPSLQDLVRQTLPDSVQLSRHPAVDVWPHLGLRGQVSDSLLETSFWGAESRAVETIDPPPQRELPSLLQDRAPSVLAFTIDRATHDALQQDLAGRLQRENVFNQLPSAKLCHNFLLSYMECFHGHLPIIHLPTFDLMKAPSPLTLALCCIGALYRLDRRRARQLYDLAAEAVESVIVPSRCSSPPTKDCPLWLVQSKMLLSIYSLLSGDSDLASYAMEGNGFFPMIYKRTRGLLAEHTNTPSNISWPNWVERESWKRILGGLYITSTLTMVIYDVNPGFTVTQDLELETFHAESLWNARTPMEWRELWSKQPVHHDRNVKDVLEDVISEGNQGPLDYSLTLFNALLLMHAVVVHMWQRLQIMETFPPLSSNPTSADGTLGSCLMESSLQALARCQRLLQGRWDQHEPQHDSDDDSESALVFNCQAVLRIAHIRLFNVTSKFDRMCLITMDQGLIEASASTYVAVKLNRSPQLLSAVTKAFEGLRIPVKMGHMLIRKTAAFRWSVEQAISGWDSALFVTKWIHSVEIDKLNGIPATEAEEVFLANIRDILEEADYDLDESKSLAAGVARTWGWFLQDVWVWGITPRMGAILNQLAMAYERVNNDNH
ncbi:hypothetical protein EDB81DRAFT_951610 [Dactylonectria macrodidyma]|uniref:C2H2-type domain-containing protein n=1 Tax=Dactylonectria macrodidyma TaxID=307937 RepID=A0A9P9DPX4_9HYPO|nr:hypothetical protein EDB81DRAFT_951610 [Dactylonectria macrodidyma]